MEEAKGPNVVQWLLEELGETHLWDLLWDSTLWAVLGGALGVALGLLAFFALRALSGFKWEWRHAKWLRGLTALLFMAGGALSFGAIGLVDGALRGSETVLRKSQLATEAFPVVGDALADMLASLYLMAPQMAEGKPSEADAESQALFEAFQAGEWELDISELFERADSLSSAAADELATEVEDGVLTNFPSWKGGRLELILHRGLAVVGNLVLEQGLEEGAERAKDEGGETAGLAMDVVMSLPEAAAASGDPATMSRDEISSHFVQEGIIPVLLIPMRQFARSQQLTIFLVTILFALFPVVLFRLAEHLRQRRSGPEPQADTPEPSEPPEPPEPSEPPEPPEPTEPTEPVA